MAAKTDSVNASPIIVTIGDPAGIGPEIVHASIKKTMVLRWRDVFVVGDLLPFASSLGENTELHLYNILPYEDFLDSPEAMLAEFESTGGGRRKPYFLDLGESNTKFKVGKGSAETGELALSSLMAAIELIEFEISDTLVTAPISKQWIHEAGFSFPGHTEALGEAFNGEPVMTFVGGGLRVALATIHEPLSKVSKLITEEQVEFVVKSLALSLESDFLVKEPRIALCGLNPHAGEEGKFGDEEENVLRPVVRKLRKRGIGVSGPYPADTIFLRALNDEFDGVVAMYHDQGLIPVKTLSLGEAVNFTANLDIVRTSPDHGTAYDIAGQGRASPESMLAALELADAISRRRCGERVEPSIAEQLVDLSRGRATKKLTTRTRPSGRTASGRRTKVTPKTRQ